MKRTILLLTLLLVACSPFAPQPSDNSDTSSLPTAYIDPSYPTVQAAPAVSSIQSSGIEVTADRAWRDGKEVNVNVCYTLLDASDWSIWGANLQYAGGGISDFGTTMVSVQEPVEGQSGKRCDTLSFLNVPPDADLSNVTVTIDSIAAQPRSEDYCNIYMPKIQQSLSDRGIGITLACSDVNGVQTMQIASKPDTMSQEEAEQLVFSDEYFSVKGPWSFTFNLGQ
jgi:hypothetical protein